MHILFSVQKNFNCIFRLSPQPDDDQINLNKDSQTFMLITGYMKTLPCDIHIN